MVEHQTPHVLYMMCGASTGSVAETTSRSEVGLGPWQRLKDENISWPKVMTKLTVRRSRLHNNVQMRSVLSGLHWKKKHQGEMRVPSAEGAGSREWYKIHSLWISSGELPLGGEGENSWRKLEFREKLILSGRLNFKSLNVTLQRLLY